MRCSSFGLPIFKKGTPPNPLLNPIKKYPLMDSSQLLAEYDFPSSGLGKVAGSFLLPISPDTATDPRLAQYQFYFLSLITVRKLGNRILYYMYRRGMISKLIVPY